MKGKSAYLVAKEVYLCEWQLTYLTDLMKLFQGNIKGAAKHLGIDRGNLLRMVRKVKLNPQDFRPPRQREIAEKSMKVRRSFEAKRRARKREMEGNE